MDDDGGNVGVAVDDEEGEDTETDDEEEDEEREGERNNKDNPFSSTGRDKAKNRAQSKQAEEGVVVVDGAPGASGNKTIPPLSERTAAA